MLANFAAIEGAVVRDVGGGQRPQPPVELDLGAGQVSGHEVGHGPGIVLAGVAGGVEGAAGDHPPVVHSDIRVIGAHRHQLSPARAHRHTLHIRTSSSLNNDTIKIVIEKQTRV